MTPPRRTPSSISSPLCLGALAASALLGLVGCATDPSDDLAIARSEGPLVASPGNAELGRFRVGSSGELDVRLDNRGRSEIIIRQVSLIPPVPYESAYVPPDPCYPPDPYHNPPADYPPDPYHNPPADYPPDPYHNPPGDNPPETYLSTRLIVPCVRPDDSTTLTLGFAARDAGGFAAGVRIEYATADGGAFTLTVPATACAVR